MGDSRPCSPHPAVRSATLSLALLEPATFALGQHDPAAPCGRSSRPLTDLPDRDWVIRFLKAVGSDPDALSPELVAAAVALVPVLHSGQPL